MIRFILPLLVLWATAAQAYNVIFILSDDHRYDFMGFMPEAPEFLETPNLDRLAREGAHLKNAFVSTSLCSPVRSISSSGRSNSLSCRICPLSRTW